MPLGRYLQHGLTGRGPCVQVADCVPETHPIRPWAETLPWAAMGAAVARSFAQRFPTLGTRGRPPVSTRVLWALAGRKPELTWADEPIWSRGRTDLAGLYTCGITAVRVDRAQAHGVRPDVLAHVRRRLDEPLLADWLAIQAATAREDGVVSPAHVGIDTCPCEHGSPRVNEAATRYQAPQKSSSSSSPSRPRAPRRALPCRRMRSNSRRTSRRACAASAASVGGGAKWEGFNQVVMSISRALLYFPL